MKFNQYTPLLAILSIFVSSGAMGGDKCVARTDGISFAEAISFQKTESPEFIVAKKRMNIAQELLVVPTNGFRLNETLTFDGDQEGSLLEGTSFEYRSENIGDNTLCAGEAGMRGKLYLCLRDEDKDNVYEKASIAKSDFWNAKTKDYDLQTLPSMTAWSDYLTRIKTVEELPVGMPVIGRAIRIGKLKKDYVIIDLAASGTFKEEAKKNDKSKGLSMWYAVTLDSKKVFFDNLAPIEIGGYTVSFKKDDDGVLFVSAVGSFKGVDPTYTCENTQVNLGKMKITHPEGAFESRMGSVAVKIGY